jgi:hypothetical protein
LSPDAASEYVTGRLDAQQDMTQAVIRYLSYAPLLLGLMGTTLALRTLLVTGGNTLQEIQPQLSGVFAGTLAGIVGSLVAAVGGLLLDRVALSTSNRAQDFIYRHILPMLPERRIAIRIEEAVLTTIAERAQAVVDGFRIALQPVAAELEDVAVRCAEAAQVATAALSEAARAVREAGNIEAASQNFKKGAHMIDSSAEQLSDATKQTAEIVLRAGEVRGSLKGVLDRLEATSENLGAASKGVTDAIAAQASTAHASSTALREAVEILSAELHRRANSDSAQVEAIRAHAAVTSANLGDVAQVVRHSADDIRSLRSAIDAVETKAVEAITQTVGPKIDQASQRTDAGLRNLEGALNRAVAVVGDAAAGIRQASERNRTIPDDTPRSHQEQENAPPQRRGFFGRFLR